MDTVLVVSLLVFGGALALINSILSVMSAGRMQVRQRLSALEDFGDPEHGTLVVHERDLQQLHPLERWLEETTLSGSLGQLARQAGGTTPGYRIALAMLALAAVGGTLAMVFLDRMALGLLGAIVGGALPPLKLLADRHDRLKLFNAQLPDALDLMSRSLRAGVPPAEAFKFVAEEMQPPLAPAFGRVWSQVAYGATLKAALTELARQTPSMSLGALVTAILVQRETGGNLAEVLDRIATVVRSRLRFDRRLRTLTAEGRVSAAVLVLMPFILAAVLSITSPTYLPMLFGDPLGVKLAVGAGILMAFGIVWISRIIRIEV